MFFDIISVEDTGMKLNNKGFALTSMIYMLIVLFLMVLLLVLSNLASRKVVLDKLKYDVKVKLDQDVNSRSFFRTNQISGRVMSLSNKVGSVQYFTGGNGDEPDNVVFFDPITGEKNCTTYHADNSIVGFNGVTTGTGSTKTTDNQTSCLKWFIYSIDDKGSSTEVDDVVNIILDHNTTSGIAWNNDNGSNSTNYSGPNTAFLTQLENDTTGWTSNKIINPSSYTASWDYDENDNGVIDQGEHNTYTVVYTTKARLMEADEVAKIKGDSSWTYMPNSAAITTNNYKFLNINLNISGETNVGYWMITPRSFDNYDAWCVYLNGGLDAGNIYQGAYYGIRPVISVLKNDIM